MKSIFSFLFDDVFELEKVHLLSLTRALAATDPSVGKLAWRDQHVATIPYVSTHGLWILW